MRFSDAISEYRWSADSVTDCAPPMPAAHSPRRAYDTLSRRRAEERSGYDTARMVVQGLTYEKAHTDRIYLLSRIKAPLSVIQTTTAKVSRRRSFADFVLPWNAVEAVAAILPRSMHNPLVCGERASDVIQLALQPSSSWPPFVEHWATLYGE